MEKNFLSHLPPRLVIGHRWYIVYYQTNPKTGKRVRFRETYELNRIRDEEKRKEKAQQILDELEALLCTGYPFAVNTAENSSVSLLEAIEFGSTVMLQGVREETNKAYRSIVNIFTEWVQRRKIGNLKISRFSKANAVEYMDHLTVEREIGAVAWNNYLARMKILFGVLLDRDYIKVNPFTKIKKKTEEEKKRRIFTPEERGIMAKHIHDKDPQLFLVILLIYHCFIRPGELRRLRFKDFDLANGIIHLPARSTKTKKSRVVTIPDIIKPYFYNPDFTKHPSNYLVFGHRLNPHLTKGCGHNTMNNRHQKIAADLAKRNLIDPEGISLYSWKDTGITDATEYLSIIELMNQAGHADPKQTMTYYNRPKMSQGFKNIKNNLV